MQLNERVRFGLLSFWCGFLAAALALFFLAPRAAKDGSPGSWIMVACNVLMMWISVTLLMEIQIRKKNRKSK